MKYCVNCVMPDTKPDLLFDENGLCSACKFFSERTGIDWNARKDELNAVLEKYRSKDGGHWDCVIPVSGGKDSTYQVIKMLELGMTPLCVTGTTCDLSDLGRRNIENIKSLGVDYIEFSPNPVINGKLNKIGLSQVGDISWPEHVKIFTIPVRAAVQYEIPLIVWGENSQHEYGGPASAADNNVLNRRWLEEFGGLLGMRVSDLVGQDGIEERHLLPYKYPSDEQLAEVGVTGLFLGHYVPWDGLSNTLLAIANGFETYPTHIESTFTNYENLDNHQTGIHDYFKFLKFGFGRTTDLACMQVRRSRISREEAVKLVNKIDGRFPWTYLGKPIEEILGRIGLTLEEFEKICDRFTNKKIFKCDSRGNLVKDSEKNLERIIPLV